MLSAIVLLVAINTLVMTYEDDIKELMVIKVSVDNRKFVRIK